MSDTESTLYFYYNWLFSQDRNASIDIPYAYLGFKSIWSNMQKHHAF